MSEIKRDRDRATEAFRRWARAGCPGPDQIRDGKGAEDLRACVAVFAVLGHSQQRRENFPAHEIECAVRDVYMAEPTRKLRWAEISGRVRRVAFCLCADERTVYRWLSTARRMWADFRDKTCQ